MRQDRASGRVALLLIGHGSRVAAANRALRDLARTIRARFPGRIVEACFLEAARPDLPAGIARCVRRGARRVLFVPYFLSPGGHVGRDLPRAAERALKRHAGLRIRMARPLGADPDVAAIVSDRVLRGLRAARWS